MDDGNYVTLATVHAVKGLEYKCVFICGLEENILPVSRAVGNDDDMEEERRLMYVAITRAQKRLYLPRSKSRYLYGARQPSMRSRFLKELKNEVEIPEEERRQPIGFQDEGYSTYGGGRYASNGGYGGRNNNNFYRNGETRVVRPANYGAQQSGYASNSYAPKTAQREGGITYGGMSRTSAPKPVATKDLSGFKIGVTVSHPKFGKGVIVGVKGMAANLILDIAFEGLGIKQLSASLAPLTIL
jgi:DNA helicase-2/ATP-dependent DNA helicase PcrA